VAFKKGQSGNPAGRPKGIHNQADLRRKIMGAVPEILAALEEAAKRGDPQAAKLLLDRAIPVLRPTDQPVSLPLGDDLAANGRAVVAAVGEGRITPDQASTILQGLGALARVVEIDELVRRVEQLEQNR
jgi:hypothetical protein